MVTTYRTGLDIGSTTAKIAVLNGSGELVWSRYVRHNARIAGTVSALLEEASAVFGNAGTALSLTGSIGMGVAKHCELPFTQEVVAAARTVRHNGSPVRTMIDIGGEDAKVVFFDRDGNASDLRMNGNCAGGTGAFIDQMALLLGEDPAGLGRLALKGSRVYPLASRCGVFCKTDIQNLIARNASREDIAASIFHAVAVQTLVTLSHGCDIEPPVVFCGGPLTCIPALRKAFCDYLKMGKDDLVEMGDARLLSAVGSALGAIGESLPFSEWKSKLEKGLSARAIKASSSPLFSSEGEYRAWRQRLDIFRIPAAPLPEGQVKMWIGIDSGSTTTKIVALEGKGRMVFDFYHANDGDPVGTVRKGLVALQEACDRAGTRPMIGGGCCTGYGEDLIRAAFSLEHGIVETMAHFTAAARMDPDVSFILDIGGQDMKALYVDKGVINRIEINEACSSGCGSFIETFACSMGYDAGTFAAAACLAAHPCDLGTRCTVFMNSKVKEVLREGYEAADIAAGLAFSVVRNCLFKVLKITDVSEFGTHVIVQGGTMKNDAVVRALEQIGGVRVSRSDRPELMGAYGCALYAMRHANPE